MKVLNSKGIASHTGPESCVAHREVRDEALTGELAGQPLSREIFISVQGADAVSVVERNTGVSIALGVGPEPIEVTSMDLIFASRKVEGALTGTPAIGDALCASAP